MKKTVFVGFLVCLIGLFLCSCGLGNTQPELHEEAQPVIGQNGAKVWIDFPLHMSTIDGPSSDIIAHAYLPGGISAFNFFLNGEFISTIPLSESNNDTFFVETFTTLSGFFPGVHIIKVEAINSNGEITATDEIEVFVEGELIVTDSEVQETDTPPRCDLFDPSEISLFLFDIKPEKPVTQGLYFFRSEGWPGIETPMTDEYGEFYYTAELGGVLTDDCAFFGYAGQLACTFELEQSMMDTAQELYLWVNDCPDPIFHHGWVSIIAPSLNTCSADLPERSCEAQGGTFIKVSDTSTVCTCPKSP